MKLAWGQKHRTSSNGTLYTNCSISYDFFFNEKRTFLLKPKMAETTTETTLNQGDVPPK